MLVTSCTVRMRSPGIGSERGVGSTEAAGVFELDLMLAGGKGVGAGCRIATLYAATSDWSGCWMTGAEVIGVSSGISENLRTKVLIDVSMHERRSRTFSRASSGNLRSYFESS